MAAFALRRDFGEPDGGFSSLDLAEEGPHTAELVVAPVLQQTCRLGRDLPLAGVGQAAPCVNRLADLVDDGGGGVLLGLSREVQPLVKHYFALLGIPLALFGLWDGGNELGPPAGCKNLLGGLAFAVKLPVPPRAVVGGVEDWVIEERVGQRQFHGARYKRSKWWSFLWP